MGRGELMAGLWVGRPVDVLPPWDVMNCCCSPLAHGHPTSTYDMNINYVYLVHLERITLKLH